MSAVRCPAASPSADKAVRDSCGFSRRHSASESGAEATALSRKAGLSGTGYQPVPSGNLPDGTARTLENHSASRASEHAPRSVGQVAQRDGLVARATHGVLTRLDLFPRRRAGKLSMAFQEAAFRDTHRIVELEQAHRGFTNRRAPSDADADQPEVFAP